MTLQRLFVCMLVICTFLLLPVNAIAQMEDDWGCEALGNPRSTSTQRGGHYFTASGVVRALVVFVQFKGDTTDSNSTTWQPGQPPVFMNDVLDQNLNQQSDNGGFSHWLREMSFSGMQMYGDAYFVITDQTKSWYQSNGKDYGDVNKDVLIKLDNTPAYAHELGHLLFDAGHGRYHKDPFGVYNQAYRGLLIGRADMLNAYDRERLGWIDFNEVTAAEETIIVTETLAFALPEETHVRLTIYDLNGRLVEFDHSFIDIATHM